jgi:hypothetical protein
MGFEKQNSRAEIAKKVEIYLFDVFWVFLGNLHPK